MNTQEVLNLLQTSGISFAYHHWNGKRAAPYGVLLSPYANNMAADGKVYFSVNRWRAELYCKQKEPEWEKKLEAVLTGAEVFFTKSETYIEQIEMFQINYEFEV